MQILLTTETTNRRGLRQKSQRRMEGVEFTIGRSTRARIHLADPRVALEHARITVGAAEASIASLRQPVRVNGRSATGAKLVPGDRVAIGPFVLRVDPPPPDCQLAVTIERGGADEVSDALLRERLLSSARLPSKRRLSYLGFFGVLLVFLGLPVAWDALNAFGLPRGMDDDPARWEAVARAVSDRALQTWNPGPVSRGHGIFGDDCRACHQVQSRQPFVSQLPLATQVMDQACLACHRNLTEHVPRASLMKTADGRAFADTRCASCHRDHKDARMTPRLDALCAQCHADVKRIDPQAKSENVTDFLADHPRFRVSMVNADTGRIERVRLGEGVAERSNLKFNHALHLDRAGVRAPAGRKVMACADCHQPAADGRLIAPVSMERHCAQCHSLKFDCSRDRPDDPLECRSGARAVPHGPVETVAAALREFYARHALGDAPPDAGPPPDLPRVRPGAVLRYEDRQPVLAIADRKAREAFDALFDERNVCGTCHVANRTRDGAGWAIAPVRLTTVWMPAARFDHSRHATMACSDCHRVGESKSARDVAMPDVAACRDCHVGGKPVLGKVTSDCATCHKFHGGTDVWNHVLQVRTRSAPR